MLSSAPLVDDILIAALPNVECSARTDLYQFYSLSYKYNSAAENETDTTDVVGKK